MSYAVSLALQKAIYDRLTADPALAASVGGAIYDALPPGPAPDLFVLLGAEKARDRSDISGAGSQHDITVSVHCGPSGFARAKQVAGQVHDALMPGGWALERGHLVGLWFQRAEARQAEGGRRVELTFRARIDDI